MLHMAHEATFHHYMLVWIALPPYLLTGVHTSLVQKVSGKHAGYYVCMYVCMYVCNLYLTYTLMYD